MKTWKLILLIPIVLGILFGGLFVARKYTVHDCVTIAHVHEVFNDSTYVIQTIELCHGSVR